MHAMKTKDTLHALCILLVSLVSCGVCLAEVRLAGLHTELTLQNDGSFFVSLGRGAVAEASAFGFKGRGPDIKTPDGRFSGAVAAEAGDKQVGSDALGEFEACSQVWMLAGAPLMTATFRLYRNVAVVDFEVTVHQELRNVSMGNENLQVLSFPAFDVAAGEGSRKAFFAVSGNMMSKYKGLNEGWLDEWAPRKYLPSGFLAGLPLGLFDESMNSSLVMSPFNNFVVASHQHQPKAVPEAYSSGIIGSIDTIPAGFTYRNGLVWVNGGLNSAFEEWGKVLRTLYPISSTRPIDKDRTVEYLSYWTDNGAYYYYNPSGTYEQTLKNVLSYLDKEGIPIGALQIDSWFYHRGDHNGVLNWTAGPEIFESGMDVLLDFDLPIVAHNRYWDVDNIYDVNNGGAFQFIGSDGKHSVPIEQRFWDELMRNGTKWGLAVYEQDWIYRQMTYVDQFMADTTLARDWLMQMGNAATSNGVTVQYCGQLTRHLLAAVEIPAVTHVRASGDYGKFNQWSISDASMIVHALRMLPFKDVFWSTSIQPGNPYDWLDHKPVEMCPEIEALVSTLSTGPVAFGDGIGYANKHLLMKSCMKKGKLLKPSRPAVTPDAVYYERAFRPNGMPGVVSTTYTRIGDRRWDIVLGAVLLHENAIRLNDFVDLTATDQSQQFIKFRRVNAHLPHGIDQTVQPSIQNGACVSHVASRPPVEELSFLNDDQPIELVKSLKCGYQLWGTAPVLQDGTVFLGELDKWVHVSPQRVLALREQPFPVATIEAVEGERVALYFTHVDDLSTIYAATCVAREDGKVVVPLQRPTF